MLILWLGLLADLSGTWVGSVKGGPLCVALSQGAEGVSGNVAYENDRKYGAISKGKVDGELLEFEVQDLDRGAVVFRFRLEGEKLVGQDGTVLTKWVPARNRQFDAGRPVAPSVIKSVSPKVSGSGTVKLSILILTNGEVDRRSIRVTSSAGAELDEAAIEAVRQWKLTPPREDCSFYEKRMPVEFTFRKL